MEIILLQDVEKLGLRGDVVSVADGYARNFLIPRRFAERATEAKVAEIKRRDEIRARQEARTAEQAQAVAAHQVSFLSSNATARSNPNCGARRRPGKPGAANGLIATARSNPLE